MIINLDINFKGAFIGGPWIDAEVQMTLDSYYLYVNGKFNWFQYIFYTSMSILCRIKVMFEGLNAYEFCSYVNSVKDKAANLINDMNINETRDYIDEYREIRKFWNRTDVQKELGVCCQPYETSNRYAGRELRKYDWLVPYGGEIAFILDKKYPVTLLYGDLDYTCQYIGGLAVLEAMNWYGAKEFLHSQWEKQGKYGKRRRVDKFTVYMVYNAGHLIPKNQPEIALKLLDEFIKDNS